MLEPPAEEEWQQVMSRLEDSIVSLRLHYQAQDWAACARETRMLSQGFNILAGGFAITAIISSTKEGK